MRLRAFCSRTMKEIIRDPLNLCFGLGFPIVLLLLLSLIQSNIPVDLFRIERLAPGISVFGLSFMTLFSATLVSKDRESAFLQRLYTTPMRAGEFILGYFLPVVPIAFVQGAVCYLTAIILGLEVNVNIIYAVLMLIPSSLFFIALGLLCGSAFGVKQVGGICGALLTNLTAWMSGAWFDLDLVGGAFKKVAYMLPFVHSVEIERAAVAGDFTGQLDNILWVLLYGAAALLAAILMFLRQMKRN